MANFDELSPKLFVGISKFRTEVKDFLTHYYQFTEEEACIGIYNYRKVFPKLMEHTKASEVASKIRQNQYIGGAEQYEEYLDSMNSIVKILADSKKLPEVKNKAAEICPSCKLFKYIGESCTFCGSNDKGLKVTS